MHSATIPLAALATFAAVYWITPAPAVVAEAVPVVEARPAAVLEPSIARAGPSARRAPATPARRRAAPKRRSVAAQTRSAAPIRRAPAVAVYYSGCNEVRAAGLAPLYRGQPGYRPGMDGDDDGIACEPYRGRGRRR